MSNIFMNTENSKTSETNNLKFILQILGEIKKQLYQIYQFITLGIT